jgi:PII-like signaling protein
VDTPFKLVVVYANEETRRHGAQLPDVVVKLVHDRHLSARTLVTKAVAGGFENGEVSTHHLLDLSYNLPVKIEVLLPAAEAEELVAALAEIVTEGVVAVQDIDVRVRRLHA